MRAVILGAGRGIRLVGRSTPKCLVEGLAGWRVLDWLLNALQRGDSVDDIVFVAGDDLSPIQAAYPQLTFRHNPDWREHHVVGSLACLTDADVRSGYYFTYSDIVYRPEIVEQLARCEADIAIVVDRHWQHRYQNRDLADAEKVVLAGDQVLRVGKTLELGDDITGEFIGLARFSARGAALLRSLDASLRPLYAQRPYRGARNLDNACLSDLLQELVDQGVRIQAVVIDGDWAELDDPQDLSRFVFGTKAETLERLGPLLKSGRIDPGVVLPVGDWLRDPTHHAQRLAQKFPQGPVAVRSSARSEDTQTQSAAGRYTSVLGVEGGNATALQEAVDQVVASYEDPEEDQVLIQSLVTEVQMSGVLMTRDLDTGADYMVVNYDEVTGRTDSVTAGDRADMQTVRIRRDAPQLPPDPRLQSLVNTAAELESITGSDALDIEFAITPDQPLHILQVRPIAAAAAWSGRDRDGVGAELDLVREFVRARLLPSDDLPGHHTVLGQMPDWNPAEMIGPFPSPLAMSLYRTLITDRTWSRARAELGYAAVPDRALMVEIAGRPYIDVRLSALNLLPANLDAALRGRIVDAGVQVLKSQPHLHDKIEFEVFATALDLGFAATRQRLGAAGLSPDDLNRYETALRELTDRLVTTGEAHLAAWLGGPQTPVVVAPDEASMARAVSHAREHGTHRFAMAARLAFIATAILRSLHRGSLLSDVQLDRIMGSVDSVSAEFTRDLSAMHEGSLSRADVLARYGHLRPGTYDLLSPRYDAAPEIYLAHSVPPPPAPIEVPWEPGQRDRIDAALHAAGFSFDLSTLLSFARASIAGREALKLSFTRDVSAILEAVAAWGQPHGLSREELSQLRIEDITGLADRAPDPVRWPRLVRTIADRRVARERQALIALPILITELTDVDCVRQVATRPNFVGRGRHSAEVVDLSAEDSPDLNGKLVVVESADPGFDWIFGHGIAGLITRFGGANSHMTIRCAEFGLPAAIGCGDAHYQRVRAARQVELDCDGEQIHVLA